MEPQLSELRWGKRIIYGDDDFGGGYDNVRRASVCSLDDLPNQGTGNRHIIVAGSRTSRWPILTLSESQHQQVCQHFHQPESINQVYSK